jgi:hypothetical protein
VKVEILRNVRTSVGAVWVGEVRDDLPDADVRTLLLLKAAKLVGGKGPTVETAEAKPEGETAEAKPEVKPKPRARKRAPAKRKPKAS